MYSPGGEGEGRGGRGGGGAAVRGTLATSSCRSPFLQVVKKLKEKGQRHQQRATVTVVS